MSTSSELMKSINQGDEPLVIDVRTPGEFRSMHISTAKNIPLNDLKEETLSGTLKKEDKGFLICQSGMRSQKALEQLQAQGYSNVESVDGGMNAWKENGFPIIKGKQVMSIERQVRIAAGTLVVLGVILSLSIHQGFLGLSAFVGAGLVFAGITDTCGMGMMLARMPWNR